jgi:hypothetical protein
MPIYAEFRKILIFLNFLKFCVDRNSSLFFREGAKRKNIDMVTPTSKIQETFLLIINYFSYKQINLL